MRQRQPKTWFVPLFICALVVVFVLQLSPSDMDFSGGAETSEHTFPETYVVGMLDRTYDATGTLKHTLRAERVNYYQSDSENRGDIIAPAIEFYSEDKPPWHLRAKQGTADNRKQTLMLEQNVTANSNHPKYGKITISTEDLLIHTDRQFAHTDKPVTIRSARGKTTAVGLNAAIDLGQIELLSEVKSLYEPL